jgi:uroporphyrinogen III methyltransferase/synthase
MCGPPLDYAQLGNFPGTLVFYMGISSARQWSQALVRGGRSPDTPVAVVRRVSWPDQQVYHATLGTVADLIEREQIRPPTLIVVGETVELGSGESAPRREEAHEADGMPRGEGASG